MQSAVPPMLSDLIRVMDFFARHHAPLKVPASEAVLWQARKAWTFSFLLVGNQRKELVGLGGLEPPTSPLSA